MKPYGYKRTKKMIGDGCFYCTLEKKATKTVNRSKAKKEIKKDLANLANNKYSKNMRNKG